MTIRKGDFNLLEHIKLIIFRAEFSALENGQLPEFLGSTIRGILGHAIRDFVCDNSKKKCLECERKKECLFVNCFASTGGIAGAVNPFTINVITRGKKEWKKGERCIFELLLIGNITEKFNLFLDALLAMNYYGWGARRVPFNLEQITDAYTGKLIFAANKVWLRNISPFNLQCENKKASTVLLRFHTPVHIKKSNRLCESLDFGTIIQFLTRRFSLLSLAYANQKIEWESEFLERAEHVKIVDSYWEDKTIVRYSLNGKNNKLVLPAIEGWLLCEGEIAPYMSVLEAGKFLKIGRNTTHGFGSFEVYYV